MHHGGTFLQPGRLNEYEAKQVLRDCGISCPRETLLTDDHIPDDICYPAYVKICSRDIVHKSDAGLVARARSRDEAEQMVHDIRERARRAFPDAMIQGILVSEDVSTGDSRELILGTTRDRDFGPVVSLGIGGVSAEIYADVAFRALPLKKSDVYDMLHELQGRAMLAAFRGKPPVNLAALTDTVLAFSSLLVEHPEIVEGDVNPLLVDGEGATAADAYLAVEK
ncbi:MAG: acetate--CoA ligase family protein [Thermoplasmatota archaeon]